MRMQVTERDKRASVNLLVIAGWIGSIALVILRALEIIDVPESGVLFLTASMALGGMLVRNRMIQDRLVRETFSVGMQAAAVARRTPCIIESDLDCNILRVRNPQTIGWPAGRLEGMHARSLVPERLHVWYDGQIAESQRDLTQHAVLMPSIEMPIIKADGRELEVGNTLSRLGDRYIAHLFPL